jgi:hypothetical protein
MIVVRNVEQYLWYEIMATLDAFVRVGLGKIHRERSVKMYLNDQVGKLRNAFHLFMLDMEKEEFQQHQVYKALKLPSEERGETSSAENTTSRSNDKPKSESTNVGKQLQLFFVRPAKKALLTVIKAMECIGVYLGKVNAKKGESENTWLK